MHRDLSIGNMLKLKVAEPRDKFSVRPAVEKWLKTRIPITTTEQDDNSMFLQSLHFSGQFNSQLL